MQRSLKHNVHKVWLAGLGALAAAEREGGELFSRLVREGERVERDLTLGVEESAVEPQAELADKEILAGTGLLLERLAEQQAQMQEMIDAMMPSTIPSSAAVLQARRNAAARAALLEEFGALTSLEVADLAGSKATNRAALANRWKQEGRIFGVSVQGEMRFPSFQFDSEGRPREVIAAVIEELAKERTQWQLALWFLIANGWLDDRRPVDLLDSEPKAVIEAARQESVGLDF